MPRRLKSSPRSAAQTTAGAAFAAGNTAAGHAALAAIPQGAELRGTSIREELEIEIVDPAQVPGQFWSPDPVKISEFVKATGGQQPIPGVRIVRRPIVTTRT